MKSKIFSFVAFASLVAGLSSCNDDTWAPNPGSEDGEGTLNTESVVPTIVNEEKILSDSKPSSRAVTNLSDYIVTVTDVNGNAVANWTYSTMPSLPTFPVGTYKISVKSHEVNHAAWEEPYFLGEQSFTIKKNEITDVENIRCVLSNIRVTVKFDDKLVKASANDIKVTVTSHSNHQLEYAPAETRSGYFAVVDGLQTLAFHFTGTINGNAEDFTHVLSNIEAGQHRIITFTLKENQTTPPDEFGTIERPGEGEGISVDTNVVKVDLTSDTPVEEEVLPDDDRPNDKEDKPNPGPDDPQPPTPGADIATFTSETVKFDAVNEVSEFAEDTEAIQDAIVNISVPKGVKNLKVTIKNDELEKLLPDVGLDSTFDLAEPGDLRTILETNFGFPVAENVIGKPDVTFDITNFVPLLNLIDGEQEFEFLIEITDQDGQSGATGTLSIKFHKN